MEVLRVGTRRCSQVQGVQTVRSHGICFCQLRRFAKLNFKSYVQNRCRENQGVFVPSMRKRTGIMRTQPTGRSLTRRAQSDSRRPNLPRGSGSGLWRFFYFFIFHFRFFTKKNIFLFSKFTVIYPGRPAAGRPGSGRPAAGRQGFFWKKIRWDPWRTGRPTAGRPVPQAAVGSRWPTRVGWIVLSKTNCAG